MNLGIYIEFAHILIDFINLKLLSTVLSNWKLWNNPKEEAQTKSLKISTESWRMTRTVRRISQWPQIVNLLARHSKTESFLLSWWMLSSPILSISPPLAWIMTRKEYLSAGKDKMWRRGMKLLCSIISSTKKNISLLIMWKVTMMLSRNC